MRQENSDENDDLINPLTPWRSAALIFVGGWGAVLLKSLGLPGSYGGFHPWQLLLPFLAVAGYWAFWLVWRLAERRRRRRSRERRALLGHDRAH